MIPNGPHPEEAALLCGRLEGWTQAPTRSILRDASLRDAPQDEADVGSRRNMYRRSQAKPLWHADAMILSLPLLARWCASISRTASAMRAVHIAVAGVALFIGIVASVGLVHDWRGAWGAGLAVLMVAIAAVDARRFIIPDELTAAALALGLAYAAVADAEMWAQALAWAVWRGREGIGLGDVKLAAVAGVWLDWSLIPVAIEIAAVTALGAYLMMHFYFR